MEYKDNTEFWIGAANREVANGDIVTIGGNKFIVNITEDGVMSVAKADE